MAQTSPFLCGERKYICYIHITSRSKKNETVMYITNVSRIHENKNKIAQLTGLTTNGPASFFASTEVD